MTGQLERKGTSATAMPQGSPRRAVPRCGGADGACSVRGISAPVGASHCVAGGDDVAVESERHTVEPWLLCLSRNTMATSAPQRAFETHRYGPAQPVCAATAQAATVAVTSLM